MSTPQSAKMEMSTPQSSKTMRFTPQSSKTKHNFDNLPHVSLPPLLLSPKTTQNIQTIISPSPKEEINSSLKCECNYSNQPGSQQLLNCQGCSLKINGNTEKAAALFSGEQQGSENATFSGEQQGSENATFSGEQQGSENATVKSLIRKLTKRNTKRGGFRKIKKTTSKRNTKNNRTKRKKLKSKVQKRKNPKRRTNKY